MSNSKVIVSADKAGNVIVKSPRNPEWGYIRVFQHRMGVDKKGFARKETVSALIPGKLEILNDFGWKKDQEIEGDVVIKEQMKPFNHKDPERDFKMAGECGIVCSVEGEPIYRKTFYTLSSTTVDVLVEHDNEDDISAAYAELKETGEIAPKVTGENGEVDCNAMQPSTEFSEMNPDKDENFNL